jgi:hypothetical protein
MKTVKALLMAASVSACVVGCGQKEAPAPPPAAREPQAAPAPPPSAAAAVKQTVDNTVVEAKKVAADAQKAAETAAVETKKAVDEAGRQAQALIDQTKAMVRENKYADALGGLQKLASLKLNPEQQTLVEGVKVEVTKLGGDIDKGITNLKTVASQKDYAQGLTLLKQLAGYQLTPEQHQVVDGLKAELQKAAGSKAGDEAKKALGNVLGGSK